MKSLLLGLAGALALSALVPAPADAGGTKVKEAEVPKAVLDAARKRHPEATLRNFRRDGEGDDARYELRAHEKSKVKEGDAEKEVRRSFDLTLSADGKVLREAERLDPKALPDAVRKALAGSRYEKMAVKEAARVLPDGKEKGAHFSLVLSDGDKKLGLTIAKDGTLSETTLPADDPDAASDDVK